MGNAVWVYLTEDLTTEKGQEKFFAWADRHDVKVVLLHLDGRNYAEKPAPEIKIAEFIKSCIGRNLLVHGMFNALTSVPEEWISQKRRELFCRDYHGISTLDEPVFGQRIFMDPNRPEVVHLLQQITSHILVSYPALSGIQLDFIRYYHWESKIKINALAMGHSVSFLKQANPLKLSVDGRSVSYFPESMSVLYHDPPFSESFSFYRNFSYCFCDYCLEGFSKKYKIRIPETLRETSEKGQWILANATAEWYEYRCSILAAAVKRIREVVKEAGEDKQLSITVWYNSPYGNELIQKPLRPESVVEGFGQNWWEWANRGLLDFVCPMNYWLKPASFEEVLQKQLRKLKVEIPIYSGLLRSHEYEIDSDGLAEYTAAVKRAGAFGISFFRYGTWQDV